MTLSAVVAALLLALGVEPRADAELSGLVRFPRPQPLTVHTGDGTRLTARMSFDGRCRGGGIGRAWAYGVVARPPIRVRNGRFSAELTGEKRNLGGVDGRTGEFTWRLSGRFLAGDVATATVTGTADLRSGRRVISRCRIAEPATVRLTAG